MSSCKDGRLKTSARQTFRQVTVKYTLSVVVPPSPAKLVQPQLSSQLHHPPPLHDELQHAPPQLLERLKVAVAVNLNLKTFSGNCFIKELSGA
jgi:hypothetical protein